MAGFSYSVPDLTKLVQVGADLSELQKRRVDKLRGDLLEEQIGQLRGMYPSDLALAQARASKARAEDEFLRLSQPELYQQLKAQTTQEAGKAVQEQSKAISTASTARVDLGSELARISRAQSEARRAGAAAEGEGEATLLKRSQRLEQEASAPYRTGQEAAKYGQEASELKVLLDTEATRIKKAQEEQRAATNTADKQFWSAEEAKASESAQRLKNLVDQATAPEKIEKAALAVDLGAERVLTEQERQENVAAKTRTEEAQRAKLVEQQLTEQTRRSRVEQQITNDQARAIGWEKLNEARVANVDAGTRGRVLQNTLREAVLGSEIEKSRWNAVRAMKGAQGEEARLEFFKAKTPDELLKVRANALKAVNEVSVSEGRIEAVQLANESRRAQLEKLREATKLRPTTLNQLSSFVEDAAKRAPDYDRFVEHVVKGSEGLPAEQRQALAGLVPKTQEEFDYMRSTTSAKSGAKLFAPKDYVRPDGSLVKVATDGRDAYQVGGGKLSPEEFSTLRASSTETAGVEAFLKQGGKKAADHGQAIVDQGVTAQKALATIQSGRQLMGNVTWGTPGIAVKWANKGLQLLGVDALAGTAAANEAFDGSIQMLTTDVVKELYPVTNKDIEFVRSSIGSSEMQREAVEALFRIAETRQAYAIERSKAYQALMRSRKTFTSAAGIEAAIDDILLEKKQLRDRLNSKRGAAQ